MLISNKIKNTIETEIKSQKALIKVLKNQESSYNTNVKEVVEHAEKTIIYYEKVLKEAC